MPDKLPPARRAGLFLVLIIALTAAVRAPLLDVPLDRDEGEYAYIAWRLGHRELPYRDWVDQKPPGIFWAYRLALSLPLQPIRAIHFLGLLVCAASACALFFLACRFMGRPWAAAAAALFVMLSADPLAQGTAANTELFMLLPLILAQSTLLRAASGREKRIFFMILSGALTGVAAAFKQVAAVNWLFQIALYPLFAPADKRLRGALSFAGWSTAGAAAVWAALAAYFFLRQGLGDFIGNVFTHNLEYIGALAWSLRLELCVETLTKLSRSQGLVWIFSAAGLLALGLAGRRKPLAFVAGWLAVGMAGVGASGYFFPHYFQQLSPALALAAAFGAEALYGARFWNGAPVWGRGAALGLLLFGLPAGVIAPFLLSYTPAEAVRKIYPGNDFAAMLDVASRMASQTAAQDRVFIFGAEPEVLFYSQRVSATRYIHLFPLYGPYRGALERQTAAAREITLNRPAAALYFPNALFFLPGSEQYFTRWSQSYLREHFRQDGYLAVDPAGRASLMPIKDRSLWAQAIGGVFLRTGR